MGICSNDCLGHYYALVGVLLVDAPMRVWVVSTVLTSHVLLFFVSEDEFA